MAYYVVTADYRPKNPKKPIYTFRTDKGMRYVRSWFKERLPWLTIYDIREVKEEELSEDQREWAKVI